MYLTPKLMSIKLKLSVVFCEETPPVVLVYKQKIVIIENGQDGIPTKFGLRWVKEEPLHSGNLVTKTRYLCRSTSLLHMLLWWCSNRCFCFPARFMT